MGSTVSKGNAPEMKVIKSNVESLRENKRILFLGAGESGKSTIIKQALRVYGTEEAKQRIFDKEKENDYKKIIIANLLEGTRNVVQEMENSDLKLSKSAHEAKNRVEKIVQRQLDPTASLKVVDQAKLPKLYEIAEDILTIAECENFRETVKRCHEFQLIDNFSALLDKLKNDENWSREGYEGDDWDVDGWKLSLDDALMSRNRTTGVTEVSGLKVGDKGVMLSLIDVGGQRCERSKWMKLFKGVTAVVFVVSLSEYNQTLFEDPSVNRLDESLQLLQRYGTSEHIKHTPFILFMNKYDLFKKKYYHEKFPLTKPKQDKTTQTPPTVEQEESEKCEKALYYLFNVFSSKVKRSRSVDSLFPHVTTALNPDNIKDALQDCAEYVLRVQIVGMGLHTRTKTVLKIP